MRTEEDGGRIVASRSCRTARRRLVLAVVIGTAGIVTGCADAPPPARTLAYDVVEEWTLPDDGAGKVIVIDPALRTVEDLRALGEQLRWEHRNDRHVTVDVFDERRAAELRGRARAEALDPAEMTHHDQHRIAVYQKNSDSGDHELLIALGGFAGSDWITVPYPRR